MAAALELVIEKGIYEKVIVTRNTPEIAESIGFLPGTEEEKMMPWLAAVTDTLEVLHKQDENMSGSLSYIMEGQHPVQIGQLHARAQHPEHLRAAGRVPEPDRVPDQDHHHPLRGGPRSSAPATWLKSTPTT